MVSLEKAAAEHLEIGPLRADLEHGRARYYNRYGASRCLCDYVMDAIPTIGYPRPCREVYYSVREEYGSVSRRHVNRALARLLQSGAIVFVRDGWSRDWGYVKGRKRR